MRDTRSTRKIRNSQRKTTVKQPDFEEVEEVEVENEPVRSKKKRGKRSKTSKKPEKVEINDAELEEEEIEEEPVKERKRPGRKPKFLKEAEKIASNNDELEEEIYPIDEKGEQKINEDGSLKGNRQYSIESFNLISMPGKLFLLLSPLIKALGIKERSHFFRLFPKIPKYGTSIEDRDMLIEIGLIPSSRRTLPVNVVTAKSAFINLGYHIIKDGTPIIDDYYENSEDSLCKEYINYITEQEYNEEFNELNKGVEQVSEKTFIYQSQIEVEESNTNLQESAFNSCKTFNSSLNVFRNRNKSFYEPHTNLFHFPIKYPIINYMKSKIIEYNKMDILNIYKGDTIYNEDKVNDLVSTTSNKYPIALKLGQKQLSFPIHSTRFGHNISEEDMLYVKSLNNFSSNQINKNSDFDLPTLAPKKFMSSINTNYIQENIINEVIEPSPRQEIIKPPSSFPSSIPSDKKLCGFYSKTTGLPCTYLISKNSVGCRYHKDLPESERNVLINSPKSNVMIDQKEEHVFESKICVHCKSTMAPLSALEEIENNKKEGVISNNDNTSRPLRKRKLNRDEMITCFECKLAYHLWCIQISDPNVHNKMKGYKWVCNECKKCLKCHSAENEDTLLICDGCDKPYHMECCSPAIKNIPKGGWLCSSCN